MKYNLAFEELMDKQFLKNSKILKISFEYSLAKIFKGYSDYKAISDIALFNDDNKFSVEKLLIYPFFISTSNGHSKYLFELFGDFYAPTIGPIPLEITRYFFVEKNKSDYFDFKQSKVEVLNPNFKNWDDVLSSILNEEIIIKDVMYKFKDVSILNDNSVSNELYKGIDSGIKILKEQSGNRFFIFNEKDLEKHSNNYRAFSSKVKLHGKIEYEDIVKDKDKLPFYANQN